MFAYISNNCGNLFFYFNENREYDHPIIGALFVNDHQYVKFCKNFDYYRKLKPVFGQPKTDSIWAQQNKSPWYQHKEISIPYPVMFLNDVEIHWIHEKDEDELLEKYNRRWERYEALQHQPFFLLSASDFCNDYPPEEYSQIVRDFSSIPKSLYLTRQSKDLEINQERIHLIERWIGSGNERNDSHILNIHTQGDRVQDFHRILKEKYI